MNFKTIKLFGLLCFVIMILLVTIFASAFMFYGISANPSRAFIGMIAAIVAYIAMNENTTEI